MSEKILGYTLLTVGILTILFSAFSVYSIFTKKSKPAQLFNFQGLGIDASQMFSQSLPPGVASLMPNPPAGGQKTELIPGSMLNESSNIFAHLLLMGFIASIGFKLASLGTMLVRPINVKLKTNEAAKNP